MNSKEKILNYLDNRKIPYRKSSNGFAVLERCLFCDSKLKLGVNLDNPKFPEFFFKCFKCEVKGHFVQVVQEIDECSYAKAKSTLGIEVQENDDSAIINPELARKIKEAFGNKKEENIQAEVPIVQRVFSEFDYQFLLTTTLSEEAKIYLHKRGFTDQDIKKSGVMVRRGNREELLNEIATRYNLNKEEVDKLVDLVKKSKDDTDVLPRLRESALQKYVSGFSAIRELGRLNGRVVFPVMINGQFTGYVARDFRPNPFVKVLNSFGLDAYATFWNFDNIRKSKRVVVTEGIFSANSVGINLSIAFLGKGVSENLQRYELLKETDVEEVIVFLDVGAGFEAKYLCSKFQAYYNSVKIVLCPTVLKITQALLKPYELRIVGVVVEPYKDSEIYISYENYFVCKKAIKIATAEYKDRHKVFTIIKRQVHDKNVLQKIVQVSRVCSQSPEFQKMIEIIAKGDFLDANDFGREINNKLINKACTFDYLAPAIQFLDKTIVKLPS